MIKVKPDSPNAIGADARPESSSVHPLNGISKLDSKSQTTNSQGSNPPEFGGADGPDPTRYGDWEHKGRCFDF